MTSSINKYFYICNDTETVNQGINNITAYKHVGRYVTVTFQDLMDDLSPYVNEYQLM